MMPPESTRAVKYRQHRMALFIELADLPDSVIAEQLGVTRQTIWRYRKELERKTR